MPLISLVIISKNEAKHIADCIRSVGDLADEVVVVDDFSEDGTADIAKGLGAVVKLNRFEDFGAQKRLSVALASHDWVLALDADERLSPELRESISTWKSTPAAWGVDALSFNRRSYYCGKAIRYCGWYPDRKIRLWDRRKGNWNQKKVHEGVEMRDGAVSLVLHGDLLHYTMDSVDEHLQKTRRYARIKGDGLRQKPLPYRLAKCLFNPPFVFFKMYFLKLGFLDGWRGASIAAVSAWGEWLIYRRALGN